MLTRRYSALLAFGTALVLGVALLWISLLELRADANGTPETTMRANANAAIPMTLQEEAELYAKHGYVLANRALNGTVIQRGRPDGRGGCIPVEKQRPVITKGEVDLVKSVMIRRDHHCNLVILDQWEIDVSNLDGDREAIRARVEKVKQEKYELHRPEIHLDE